MSDIRNVVARNAVPRGVDELGGVTIDQKSHAALQKLEIPFRFFFFFPLTQTATAPFFKSSL